MIPEPGNRDFAFVVADGRRAKYGINAIVGALDDLPDERYPAVCWPDAAEPLTATCERLSGRGILPVVLWNVFSPEYLEVKARLAEVEAGEYPGPRPLHVVGGPHASADFDDCARAGFDLVAVGEAEWTIRDLVATLQAGGDVREVVGLGFLDEEGRYQRSRGRLVDDIARFPSFAMRQGRFGPIEITRGCIYACSFCHTPYVFKARFRHRNVDSVLWHVRQMNAHGKKHVRFLTPSSLSYGTSDGTPNLDAVEELLSAVRRELPPDGKVYFGTFPSELRPEHVTVEALRMIMRHCDNDNVILGGQSGSDVMLAAAHRGHDVDAVRAAVDACRTVGLTANVDFIFGMPGETEDQAHETILFCRELAAMGARIHTHTFLPLPGTPWRHEPPGVVSDALRAELDDLTTRGAAYGSWRRQEVFAADLAAGAVPRRRRPR